MKINNLTEFRNLGYNGIMKKVKSLKELATFMEKLGATKEVEPGFTAWTLDCGPDREKYTIKEIKNAVNIVIGDDGMRSKEVIEILKQEKDNAKKRSN